MAEPFAQVLQHILKIATLLENKNGVILDTSPKNIVDPPGTDENNKFGKLLKHQIS